MNRMSQRPTSNLIDSRRKFLRYLALSPVLASPSLVGGALRKTFTQDHPGNSHAGSDAAVASIKSPDQVLDVMEFEDLARKALPPAHFAYLEMGVDDDATVRLNHEAYQKIEIRSRRLINVEKLDSSVKLFGTKWETPIFLCPVSSMRAFDPEGEVAVAHAAARKHHLQMLSTVAGTSIEDVTKARGAPVWQQLYPTNDWTVTRAIIKRAEAAGSPGGGFRGAHQDMENNEPQFRGRRLDDRKCSPCHEKGFSGYVRGKPAFDGLDISNVTAL